jgi:hypothetical protein
VKIPTNENGIPLGEHHHRARHSDELVRCIRRLHEGEGLGYRAIARLHPEVSIHTIRAIVEYRRRAGVPRGWRDAKPE